MSIVIPIDDYSPILQGDTGSPFSVFVAHKNGFLSIVDADISMTMQNVEDPSIIKVCNGVWTIDSSDNGRASYQYEDEDVDAVGSWKMWVKVVIDGHTIHPDDGTGTGQPKILVIESLPEGV